jgi:glycosyltransferase involved in cell wall biosynthesis
MRVLIVSAQFPFPPRFGFAMRTYHLSRQVATRHDVTLLSYASPDERDDVARLREELTVETVERFPMWRGAKRLAQLVSLASSTPYACQAIRSRKLQRSLDDLCARENFDLIQLESSLLFTFSLPKDVLLVVDEHNIEYEVFERLREGERTRLRRWFNRLDQTRFRRFEQRSWNRVSGCAVTSERERRIVRAHAPETPTAVVPNGVDLEYFRPSAGGPEPQTLVFNGLLQYRPNFDAAYHLVEEIWPLVLRRAPGARLTIIGRGNATDLRRLKRPSVNVTGEVPDIRPYLERAAVVAVPVRMGGGSRLKVVEGLALGKAMVSTTLGCEGVSVIPNEHLVIADSASTFADSVVRLFESPHRARELGLAGRALMEREYSWGAAGEQLEALYRDLLPEAASTSEEGARATA